MSKLPTHESRSLLLSVLRKYDDGLKQFAIANTLDESQTTISRCLHHYGLSHSDVRRAISSGRRAESLMPPEDQATLPLDLALENRKLRSRVDELERLLGDIRSTMQCFQSKAIEIKAKVSHLMGEAA